MKTYLALLSLLVIPHSFLFSSTNIPQGIAKLSEFQVNSSHTTKHKLPLVATNMSNEIYVVWQTTGSANDQVYYRKFTMGGIPLIDEQLVTDTGADLPTHAYPHISINDNNYYLITWLDERNPDGLPGSVSEIFGKFYFPSGETFKDVDNVRFSSPPERDHFHPNSDEINNYIPRILTFEVVPFDGTQDRFVIPWSDNDENVADPPTCRDLADQLAGFFYPFIYGEDAYDVFLVDNNGFPEGEECGEWPDPSYSGKEISSSGNVAIDSRDHFIFAFDEAELYGGGTDIFGQRFDQNRNPIGSTKFTVFDSDENLFDPDIMVNSTDQYYISFYKIPGTGENDLYCIKYDSDYTNPTPLDTVVVNQETDITGFNQRKNLGVFSGNYNDYLILVWCGEINDDKDIYARIYYSDANENLIPLTDEFALNETDFSAKEPAVTMVSNDRFVVSWKDNRLGANRTDIYTGIYQLDLDPPLISGTTEFDPPAMEFDPSADPYEITTWVEDNANGSGLEGDILLIYTTHPSILYGGGSVTDTVICERVVESLYRGYIDPPDSSGTYIEYYMWAQDKAQNSQTDPSDISHPFKLYVSELGDINVDGCHSNVDLALMENIIDGEFATDADSFFADINQDDNIDSLDVDLLEDLIGPYPYIGCIARIPTGPPLELAAVSGGPGETNVLVPVYLDNDSSKVSKVYFVFQYDSTVFTIPNLEQTSRSQGIPYSFESEPSKKKVRLLGNDSTYIDPGEGAILKLKVNVASNAPQGSYHFDILRAAAADTTNQDLLTQPLRGKFFIPEAPPISIICTPLGDTTLTPGDTLTFNTTLTNHSDSTQSPKFFVYGTTTGPDSLTFLAVDTTQIMMLPPGERKRDITDLEVPSGAPQGPYIFTAYVVSPVTDSTFDDDSFGFQVVGGSGKPGEGGNQLLSSGNEMGPWKVLSGWFGYNERKGEKAGSSIVSSPLPKVFSISQNFPNPFNPSTTIQFDIPAGQSSAQVEISIYDLRGRLIRKLLDEKKEPGTYQVHWDGRDGKGNRVPSGVYLYRIIAGDFISTRKMVLLY